MILFVPTRVSRASGVVTNRGESSSFPLFLDKLLFSFSLSLSSSSPDDDENNSDKSEIGAGGRAVLLQRCIILLLIDSVIYYGCVWGSRVE